jgi:hypothetical protein
MPDYSESEEADNEEFEAQKAAALRKLRAKHVERQLTLEKMGEKRVIKPSHKIAAKPPAVVSYSVISQRKIVYIHTLSAFGKHIRIIFQHRYSF